jgi:hypothetical protein
VPGIRTGHPGEAASPAPSCIDTSPMHRESETPTSDIPSVAYFSAYAGLPPNIRKPEPA